jgi:hypothetical protein
LVGGGWPASGEIFSVDLARTRTAEHIVWRRPASGEIGGGGWRDLVLLDQVIYALFSLSHLFASWFPESIYNSSALVCSLAGFDSLRSVPCVRLHPYEETR